MGKGEKMKLNLGAWNRPRIPGFTNIDIRPGEFIDHVGNIDKLPWFEDNSVELIYSSHSFEYFSRYQAPYVLREWHRVLEPGGTLRLAVPDFEKLVEVYQKTGDIKKILGPIYGIMEVNEVWSVQHQTMYDMKSLSEVLTEAGFKNIHRYDWRQTIHKDYDDHSQAYYPHMNKENGILISLNVEATK